MDERLDRLVDLFNFESKTSVEIIDIFQQILDAVFEDSIVNSGRLFVVEKFAFRIVKRAAHIDSILLWAALRERIRIYSAKWYANIV